jgi:histidyl-tRNA synthetase
MSEKSEKPKKPQKLRARLPRGLGDRGPADIAATRRMTDTIREVYERYGFEPVETPTMEFTDALGKFLPDQDRPNEGVFSFQDDDEQWISLRYDLTAPLARYVAEHWDALPKPYRSYRAGYVYRNEKPGPGRFRQFMQFDADTVGSGSPAADAEMCMMAADAMEALGIPRGSYVVKVNDRRILDGVLQSIGLGENEAGRRLTVLRAIDKMDKFPVNEIRQLLGPGRWDGGDEGKGDFTKGAGLSASQIDIVLSVVTAPSMKELKRILDQNTMDTGGVADPHGGLRHLPYDDALNEMIEQFEPLIRKAGYSSDRIRIDPTIVRGLEYYTGPVYEVELTIKTKDEKGRSVRFGSVGGGGRYDGLVSRFRGEPVPATGFSIGVSRLQAALELIHKDKPQPVIYGPVVVTVFDRDRVADYQKMVAMLRNSPIDPEKPDGAFIRAELYLGNPKNMGNQLKYADKRNSPCVIIQGSDEQNDPEGPQVILKNLLIGSHVGEVEKDREKYLLMQQQIQRKVPLEDLVKEVQQLLNWHGINWK